MQEKESQVGKGQRKIPTKCWQKNCKWEKGREKYPLNASKRIASGKREEKNTY